MNDYEARRLENIKRNQALLHSLGMQKAGDGLKGSAARPPAKRRKLAAAVPPNPTRTSARIAASDTRAYYAQGNSDTSPNHQNRPSQRRNRNGVSSNARNEDTQKVTNSDLSPLPERDEEALKSMRTAWLTWTASVPPPTRDDQGTFHFPDQPDFQPNKSPAEILHEGCFGGSYFRPLYSKTLGATISDDWRELPAPWLERLDVDCYLVNKAYDTDVNKYKVACGQSIEEWEAAGWIDHRFDPRGWFQWYCRFFRGRRCEDDERQVTRWRKCVGERGRWRRTLLKRYREAGVRSVMDEGDEDGKEVSPVVHQTCHHWAWELRQDVLDLWWAEGR